MVSLGYQESISDVQRWNHICDGSILSNRTIITSGDCLDMLSNEIKDVETKLQIRVADEDFNDDHDDDDDHDDHDDDEDDNDDDDDGVKVYFADGFRKHDSNVALIATNEYIEFNDETVKPLALPQEDISYEEEIHGQPADLAMWNDVGELEEDMEVDYFSYKKDLQHYANPMKTCKGSGASMVRRKDKESTILVGILGKADPSCENEINKQRTLATVTHPEVLNFINASKKDLELCQSLKDCFCELRDLRC